MNFNPVVWFEIYVQDMPRAVKFYEAVLGKKITQLLNEGGVEMWAFPSQGPENAGAAGALVKMEGMPSGGNSTLIYFGSDDCAAEESRVAKNGGKVIKPKFAIGQYGFICLLTDTEGNMVGVHSMK